MMNQESGRDFAAESNEVVNFEGKNFVEGLKTSKYTEDELRTIRNVLGEISKGL